MTSIQYEELCLFFAFFAGKGPINRRNPLRSIPNPRREEASAMQLIKLICWGMTPFSISSHCQCEVAGNKTRSTSRTFCSYNR